MELPPSFEVDGNEESNAHLPSSGLWHYTSGEALVSILDSKTLRASNIKHMNDAAEWKYARSQLGSMLLEKKRVGTGEPVGDLSDQVSRFVYDALDSTTMEREVFVLSLSAKEDDLSQWRGYASGGGYAIRIDWGKIVSLYPEGITLARVLYGEEGLESVQSFADLSRWVMGNEILHASGSLTESRRDFLSGAILEEWLSQASRVKHPAFKDEDEWRIVVRADESSSWRRGAVARNGYIRSYIEMPWKSPSDCPISEIMCGPRADRELGIDSVRQMIEGLGYEIKVSGSYTPLRE